MLLSYVNLFAKTTILHAGGNALTEISAFTTGAVNNCPSMRAIDTSMLLIIPQYWHIEILHASDAAVQQVPDANLDKDRGQTAEGPEFSGRPPCLLPQNSWVRGRHLRYEIVSAVHAQLRTFCVLARSCDFRLSVTLCADGEAMLTKGKPCL